MKHFFACAIIVLLACFSATHLEAASDKDVEALLAIPAGLGASPGDTLTVPVFITTLQPISAATLTIEFDQKDFKFIAATAGPDGAGFTIGHRTSTPAKIVNAGANDNVAISLASDGFSVLYGSDLNVLFLSFKVVGAAGGVSPFAFNPDSAETALITEALAKLHGSSLQFIDGSGVITNIATLSIPGGFSVPKAETLFVPVRLSTTKPVGLAQIAFDYDTNDLKFLGAQPGADAPDFSVLVETNPNFLPTALGTNKNVMITAFSGSATVAGSDKTLAMLIFLAAGNVGGNSPIAFDRRANHTVLSTLDLTDLTGADLAFRDGDATLLAQLLSISGKIFYRKSLAPVAGSVVSSSGPARSQGKSDAAGNYVVKKLTPGAYTVTPSKTGDIRVAIQGSDALLILRSASLMDTLDAEQTLSADVTRDGRVSVSDALAILRFLAAQTTGIGQTGAWIFDPETTTLVLQNNASRDFNARLLGDVDGNWAPGSSLTTSLPVASVQFGKPREDGDKIYLPLLAGSEGKVFTMISDLELPPQFGSAAQFVPNNAEVISVTNYDAAQKWHLTLAHAAGIAPQEKIGELVLPRAAANLQNLRFKNSIVNDRPAQTTGVDSREETNTFPTSFALQQNYPNPFSSAARSPALSGGNSGTVISFQLPVAGEVKLAIYSTNGQLVRSLVQGKYAPGTHRVQWDGRNDLGASVPTGVYFYRIRAGNFAASRKLTMVK